MEQDVTGMIILIFAVLVILGGFLGWLFEDQSTTNRTSTQTTSRPTPTYRPPQSVNEKTETIIMEPANTLRQDSEQREVDNFDISPEMSSAVELVKTIPTAQEFMGRMSAELNEQLAPYVGKATKEGVTGLTEQQMDAISKQEQLRLEAQLRLQRMILMTKVAQAESSQLMMAIRLMLQQGREQAALVSSNEEVLIIEGLTGHMIKQLLIETQVAPEMVDAIHALYINPLHELPSLPESQAQPQITVLDQDGDPVNSAPADQAAIDVTARKVRLASHG